MKDTLSFLVQSLLQKNKINIDSEELDFQIQSHPSYPSLHAITGVLSHFDIENTAIKVPVNETILAQLPKSFIAQIKIDNDTDFALVINKGLKYKINTSNKEGKTISRETFLEQFTGILVAVEKNETIIENKASTKKSQQILFTLSILIFVLLYFSNKPSINASLHFILSIIGIGVSYLIIQHDLGVSSKIIDSICSQESKTTNCNAVLNSKGATLYKNIKLSDISLVYFTSISIASLLLNLTNTSLITLYIISLTALPVVIYSLYYQIKISKNWCVLCLGIASVLVLQASILFFKNTNSFVFSFNNISLIIFSLITISTLWLFLSSRLKQEQDFKKLKIESSKFKRNFDLFNTLLQQSKTVNTEIINTSEIILGNKNAPLNITLITNPFCGHCKSVHNLAKSILKRHHNDVSITVRFNINTSNLESNGVLVSSRLLELFHTEGEPKCLEAMHEIYHNADATAWLAKWEKATNLETYSNILEAEYNWCLNNNINFTPEILINDKAYPKAYNREDLLFFIEELNDACYTTTIQLQETI